MTQRAHIVGNVEYRQGDGPLLRVRRGLVDVRTTAQDATLSWREGETRNVAALPMAVYRKYLSEGAIRLDA